jgi:RNA polymerase sigma-70 factor (ECF subfamily)
MMAWWHRAVLRLVMPRCVAWALAGKDDMAHDAPLPGLIAALPEHFPAMLRAATALVGAADAEDAAQEALMRAWQALGDLRDPQALRGWLLRITVNVCHQWRRGGFGRRQRLVEPLPDEAAMPLALLAQDPGASDHAARLDLRAAVDALADELRIIVVLRYYAEMDATEVGQSLGIPPATVRTRLRRALQHLRDHLHDTPDLAVPRTPEGADHA